MFSLRNEEEAFFIMKVLKFGGSSVGTPESILNVKNIVEATARPAVVVVSALGGVTDQLIAASRMAAAGDSAYSESVDSLMERHHKMVNAPPSAVVRESRPSADGSPQHLAWCISHSGSHAENGRCHRSVWRTLIIAHHGSFVG